MSEEEDDRSGIRELPVRMESSKIDKLMAVHFWHTLVQQCESAQVILDETLPGHEHEALYESATAIFAAAETLAERICKLHEEGGS